MTAFNEIENVEQNADLAQVSTTAFYNDLIWRYAISKVKLPQDKDRIPEIKQEAKEAIKALDPQDPVQTMLVIQLLSTHSLQQDMVLYAKNAGTASDMQNSSINAAIKLSNLFVAQVNLLQKLKTQSTQGTVGTVHVHEGAQAVVGTVNCYGGQDGKNRK
jgi:hypothetical protein